MYHNLKLETGYDVDTTEHPSSSRKINLNEEEKKNSCIQVYKCTENNGATKPDIGNARRGVSRAGRLKFETNC